MATRKNAPARRSARQAKTRIVGIRVAERIANQFKAEAALRGMAVNALFMEMWEAYCRTKRMGVP